MAEMVPPWRVAPYDKAGNRLTSSRTGFGGTVDNYTANALNQYDSRENNVAHVAGTAQASASVTVSSATAGSAPTAATDTSLTYAITTNTTGAKITGKINSAMPSGLTLSANLTAPTGGSANSDVALGTSDSDLVTGITKLNESALPIEIKLAATSAAGAVSPWR